MRGPARGAATQNHNGTVTKFVYDGQQVLADLNSSNATIARYTIGPIIDEVLSVRRGGSTYHYIQDVQQSVARILDQSRNVKNTYEYLPFGEVRTSSETVANRYTYTGREQNPDGRTMHYRARNYLPHLGRFGQEDPIDLGGGINVYGYVGNSPCSFVDRSGLHLSVRPRSMAEISAQSRAEPSEPSSLLSSDLSQVAPASLVRLC